ncbi:MAG: DUF2007 domain-containing protein [Candidatus Omnitrophota bacterium]
MKYCPACKTEYEDWVEKCAECSGPLGSLPPPAPPEPPQEYVAYRELLQTYNSSDVAFIKTLLESNDILFCVEGENFMTLNPGALPARVMVNADQYESAKELLGDFSGRYTSFSCEEKEKPSEADDAGKGNALP